MLDGKVAIVTGSTSGIGWGIADRLAAAGCEVMLNGFGTKSEIDDIRKKMEKEHGVSIGYSAADMSKPEEIADMVQYTEERFGEVDILVNNAGVQHVAPIEDFSDEKWESIMSINLSAPFYAIKAVLPGMKNRGWGRIINIASAHGLVASPKKAGYVATKHGLVGLTKVVALENATHNLTCNAICPGWVLTPLVQEQIDKKAEAEKTSVEKAKHNLLAEKQPSLHFSSPKDIGNMTVFLCSESARNITGTTLSMDGGWTAQ
jgi:3-hydroxybutyrate dehydrogenase